MGFQLEEFGNSTFKIEAVPQIADSLKVENILSTIARDLSESGGERIGRWKEERIAKSIAKSFSGTEMKLTEETAVKLIEELCSCKMPYICPRGKCIMIFTSTRELNRKFDRN
jgi:DNA mismatch repair protein MutL